MIDDSIISVILLESFWDLTVLTEMAWNGSDNKISMQVTKSANYISRCFRIAKTEAAKG